MGCSGSQLIEDELDDCVRAEWSTLYERRIVDSLPQAAVAAAGQNDITRNDVDVAAPLDSDLLPECCMQDADDKPLTQTIFFFDWDDTLFPSTWARKAFGLRSDSRKAPTSKKEHEEQIKHMSSQVVSLLSQAQAIGKVVVLTNASRSWVAACCNTLMPEARALLERIPFIYAMDLLSISETETLPRNLMYKEAKARAMREILATLHRSPCKLRGWVNVVSVGDSDSERIAMQEVARSKIHAKVVPQRCFAKTIRMLARPSLMQLFVQLSVISEWFSDILRVASPVKIDLGKHA